MRWQQWFRFGIYSVCALVLLVLLSWRMSVTFTRFFDVDEFSYLHWTANMVHGKAPYVDFFMFFPPVFLWVFAPVIALFQNSSNVFVAARALNFTFFLGMLGLVSLLFAKLRGRQWALLPAILLAFLPMPYDKFLEVRPDNLATLLAFGGMVSLVFGLLSTRVRKYWLWSGVLYSASLFVFPKTIPFVFVGISIAVLYWLTNRSKEARAMVGYFVLGLVIPACVVGLYLLSLGNLSQVLYSLLLLPFEANRFGAFGIMEAHLFFFPNIAFYGGYGITKGLLVNHGIWAVGLVVSVLRLLTPWISADGDRKKVLAEFLVAGTAVGLIVLYVMFYPLKHSQYLIPIALYIAWYAADALALFFDALAKKTHMIVLLGCVILLGYGAVRLTQTINENKLLISYAGQLSEVEQLLRLIPKDEAVVDLEGKMVFWPDGYSICCIPFGVVTPSFSRPPEPLSEVMERNRVLYIYQGDSGRIATLQSADQAYIANTYEPVDGWGQRLFIRK